MNRLFRRAGGILLVAALAVSMAACSQDAGEGTSSEETTPVAETTADSGAVEDVQSDGSGAETSAEGDETQEPEVSAESVTPDVTVKEVEVSPEDENYYQELLDTEIYNYKLIRNIPTAYDETSYNTYCENANILLTLDPNEIGEVQQGLIEKVADLRSQLVQIQPLEESIWYLWGDSIPYAEDAESLEFTTESYDNSDFVPFVVPYLLDDQSSVKGNMIVIAGGGYFSRGNAGEGWPIAEGFNERGYNCYVLQRRVAPYSPDDIWMDFQRSIRVVRSHIDSMGLGGGDCIAAVGFSGGSATILGAIDMYYGDIVPTVTDENYAPDEIDEINSDLDVALCIYGPNYLGGTAYEDPDGFKGLDTENPNIPAMFLAAGENDSTSDDNTILRDSVKDKALVEMHTFANVGHGFGVGLTGTNSTYWMDLADGFIDQVIAGGKAEGEVSTEIAIPDGYTQYQTFDAAFGFGDATVTLAINDDGTQFYAGFITFEELQELEGTVGDDGTVTVTFDKTGFMSGDAQMIYDSADPDAWQPVGTGSGTGTASAEIEIPDDYTQYQTFDATFGFGDATITLAINDDGTQFYAGFIAFEELQELEGIVNDDGTVTVTFDKTGFMSGDAQMIYDSADPDAWQPVE